MFSPNAESVMTLSADGVMDREHVWGLSISRSVIEAHGGRRGIQRGRRIDAQLYHPVEQRSSPEPERFGNSETQRRDDP